ncbi:MAG: M23 family metallopeptidase [Treponema sp.]|jgi:murein DD-endopeptidase MepM/ murein hydrolase activator NlpD|nr:M23 family metallopeptidase [Treponema sp.]
MIYRRGANFLLPLILSLIAVLSVRVPAEEAVHVVVKGETIYSIARSFKVSPEELMSFNSITDPSRLQVGSRLKIPGGASVSVQKPVSADTHTEYRAQKNDTLYSIARQNGVSLETLRSVNGFSETYVLKVGDRVKIPRNSSVRTVSGGGTQSSQNTQTVTASSTSSSSVQRSTGAAKNIDSTLRWPVSPKELSYMKGKLSGVSVTGERSEPVKSLSGGTVVSAGPYRGFGRVVIIQANGGYLYVYGGCESLSVKEGDRVGPGMELGKLGIDAVSNKPELFFMVYKNNAPIDPAKAPRA